MIRIHTKLDKKLCFDADYITKIAIRKTHQNKEKYSALMRNRRYESAGLNDTGNSFSGGSTLQPPCGMKSH
jgi:hypothetical protein